MVRAAGRRRAGAALALAVVVTAAACGGGGSSAGGSEDSVDRDVESAAAAAEAADRSAELTVAVNYGFSSLDPHRTTGAGDGVWMRPVYDRLVTLANGEDGVELAPQLATSWSFSDDGLSLELELRDDVRFQDGTRFDAAAVEANMARAMDDESTVRRALANVRSVEATDPTHVVFRLREPDPSIPWSFATGTVGMIVSPAALGNDDLATHPVGSGPFRLTSAQRDAEVTYERWDEHWDPDAALVRSLTIATVPDANARFNGTRSGEYDAAYLAPPLDAQARSLESEGYHWEQALSPISYGIFLHTGKAPTDDVRVRRAISLALNRPEIAEELFNGLVPPSYQPFNEGYLGHDPDLDEDPYDPEAARQLVEEAGAEGETITLVQNTTLPASALAEVVQQALGDIGLNVELVPVSPTEAIPAWRGGDYHGHVGTVLAEAEPSLTLASTYLGDDNLGEPPDELVAMADEARRLPVDSDEREQAYHELSAYLVENPIHVPIVGFSTVMLARPEVVGSDNLVVQDLGRLDLRRVGIAAS